MDFELTEDLREVRGLAEQVFADRAQVERVLAVEQNEGGHDASLWRTLADAGLLGVALPEKVGGAGLGMLGLVTILEQQGRRVAPLPLWSVLAAAALPIAEFGTEAQTQRWLPGVIDGDLLVTGAFDTLPGQTACVRGARDGDGWRLSGEVLGVSAAPFADAVVMPVAIDPAGDGGGDALVLAIVPTDRDGVTITPVEATNRASCGNVCVDGVVIGREDLLQGDGMQALRWVLRRARVALAGLQLGVCEEALAMTATYTSAREQFGRPLSTNQAVAVRAADAYLDTENIRLTARHAAWLLDEGREDEADAAALVAKYWASRGGLRVVHATQHLHGGMGADVDYPIHRYFLWGRQASFSLGSASATAAALGAVLQSAPAIGAPA